MRNRLHHVPFDAARLAVARELVLGPVLEACEDPDDFPPSRHALGRLAGKPNGTGGRLHHLLEARAGEPLVPVILSADASASDGKSWTELVVDLEASKSARGVPLRDLLDEAKVRALLADVRAEVPEVQVEAWLAVPVEG